MPPQTFDLARQTSQFAKFLDSVVRLKTKAIAEVAQYPSVRWFDEMPRGDKRLTSPLLDGRADEGDVRWLVAHRPVAPSLPKAPALCQPWLEGVDLSLPSRPPAMSEAKQVRDDRGQTVVETVPEDVLAAWQVYLDQNWKPWAEAHVRYQQVLREYEHLFTLHTKLEGNPDGLELLVGVGLLSCALDNEHTYRRHLVSFRAEVAFESTSGTISVVPSADFQSGRLETDFLPVGHRTAIEPRTAGVEEGLNALGVSLHDTGVLDNLLKSLVHTIAPKSRYVEGLSPVRANAGEAVAALAPALVLRDRGTRALVDLIDRIGKSSLSPSEATEPWRRLMEDRSVFVETDSRSPTGGFDGPLYFPLATNEEQQRIVSRVDHAAGVLVEGPPGTGKSHTIANLISHYLATGQRVLVTAQTSQALEVLRDKIPGQLREMCVSLIGNGNESDKALERSVRGVLAQFDDSRSPAARRRDAETLDREMASLKDRIAATEKELLDLRRAEAEEVEPVPGYRHSRMQLAQRLERERPRLGEIRDAIEWNAVVPEYTGGWNALADYASSLTPAVRESFALLWFAVPFDRNRSAGVLARLRDARTAVASIDPNDELLRSLRRVASSSLKALQDWVQEPATAENATGASDGPLFSAVRQSVLDLDVVRWRALHSELEAALAAITEDVIRSCVAVEVNGRTVAEAFQAVQALDEHYAAGGRRRVAWVMTPPVVKEHEWVETAVTVDGQLLSSPDRVAKCRRALRARATIEQGERLLPLCPVVDHEQPRIRRKLLHHRAGVVALLLSAADARGRLPEDAQAWLKAIGSRRPSFMELKAALLHRQMQVELDDAVRARDELCERLAAAMVRPTSAALVSLKEALRAESFEKHEAAWTAIAAEELARSAFAVYKDFCEQVRRLAPMAAERIAASEGAQERSAWLRDFGEMWRHRQAARWLDGAVDPARVASVERSLRSLRERLESATLGAATEHAWNEALQRIGAVERQQLVAWQDAVSRMTKPGSKSYFQRRAVARQFLNGALPSIPVWVASLPRVYESVNPEAGLFDLAIIDEASQCSLDALTVFFLAKRVIVVGDDKQISPMVVGVPEEGVTRLANSMLDAFAFRATFTLDSSLFSHARRCFTGDTVALKEHFRCVPEIIHFSNHLCYDNRLVPLRRVDKGRVPALMSRHVPDGLRDNDRNLIEAGRLVDQLLACHADPAYDDKTFGVICLQGHEQADVISQMLLKRAGASMFKERRLRCGEPYAFQGDERDVMFVSMVAAPNVNNGTLSADQRIYVQRFNVAMSRARDQMWLFHSVTVSDVSPSCLRRRVLDHFLTPRQDTILGTAIDVPTLQRRLHEADKQRELPPKPFDSWFEVDVAVGLALEGYEVSAQVPAGRHRIDLVITGDGTQLAIECDGDAFHGPEQYEADVARQMQLERAGWSFLRVRGSEFYHHRAQVLERVRTAWEDLVDDEDGVGSVVVSHAAPVPPPVAEVTQLGADAPVANVGNGDVLTDDRPDEQSEAELEEAAESPSPADLFGEVEQRDGPFSGYAGRSYPDPRVASAPNIRAAVKEIVTLDGPLPKASVYSLYRDGCPQVQRVSKHMRSAINRAIADLQRVKVVVVDDEGGSRRPEDVVVRLIDQKKVVARPRGRRGIDDIPLSELGAAMRSIAQVPPSPADPERYRGFVRAVLEKFGLKSVTALAMERLSCAVDYEFSRRVTAGEDGLF